MSSKHSMWIKSAVVCRKKNYSLSIATQLLRSANCRLIFYDQIIYVDPCGSSGVYACVRARVRFCMYMFAILHVTTSTTLHIHVLQNGHSAFWWSGMVLEMSALSWVLTSAWRPLQKCQLWNFCSILNWFLAILICSNCRKEVGYHKN